MIFTTCPTEIATGRPVDSSSMGPRGRCGQVTDSLPISANCRRLERVGFALYDGRVAPLDLVGDHHESLDLGGRGGIGIRADVAGLLLPGPSRSRETLGVWPHRHRPRNIERGTAPRPGDPDASAAPARRRARRDRPPNPEPGGTGRGDGPRIATPSEVDPAADGGSRHPNGLAEIRPPARCGPRRGPRRLRGPATRSP